MKTFHIIFSIPGLALFLMSQLIAQPAVLHLKMDKEAQTGISDHSLKNNHASMVGGLHFIEDRFGNECRALRFDGTGFLTVEHDRSLDLSSGFTVTSWVQLPPNTRGAGGLQWLTLVCKGENPIETDISPAFRAQLTSATASVNTASTKSIGEIRQSYPTGKWFHIAVVYDGNELRIYQDASEAGRYVLRDPIYTNSEPINIGRDIPGDTEFFMGSMDDLRIFNKVLKPAEIKSVFRDQSDRNLGSACPEPQVIPLSPAVVNTPAPRPSQQNLPPWKQMKPRETRLEPTVTPPAEPASPIIADATPPEETEVEEEDTVEPEAPLIIDETPQAEEDEADNEYSFTGVAQNNLTLLLDVSGSMKQPGKLPILKEAFLALIPHMRNFDHVSVVIFAGGAKTLLNGVPATNQGKISRAIENLSSAGNTKGKPALKKAHKLAKKNYVDQGNNRIILATDGYFKLSELEPIIQEITNDGIYLSIFSFGANNAQRSAQLDQLAELGNGNHERIDRSNVDSALLNEVKAIRE